MSEQKKIKILCVEDEQEIRENIAEILRDEGFEVVEAGDGKQGFDAFLQYKPDLIISDVMMPDVDGYGLLKLIRENKNTRNNTVPFIFLTALGQKDDIIKGANLSANDYLIKPVDFDLMIARVKEKTANSLRVQEVHGRNIQNLKSQVSLVLPSDIFSYLDIITQVTSVLRNEPYGPLPHRCYIEDFNKIHINAMKIRAAIANTLDAAVIDYKLNADEEVFSIFSFVEELVDGLSDKFKSRIQLEKPLETESMPRVKLDRLVLLDALRKIFAGIFKSDAEGLVNVSMMIDHLNQMVIIFYLKSQTKNPDIRTNVDEAQIGKILDQQNCRFTIADAKENTAVLVIPSYRLIS